MEENEKKEYYEALSILDRASSKAPLTRDEHIIVQKAIDKIKGLIDKEDGKHQ